MTLATNPREPGQPVYGSALGHFAQLVHASLAVSPES